VGRRALTGPAKALSAGKSLRNDLRHLWDVGGCGPTAQSENAKYSRVSKGLQLPYLNLFMLVSALMGRERMKDTYAYAIENGYRFYSYGDASLLLS
jgi:hypothetical protein